MDTLEQARMLFENLKMHGYQSKIVSMRHVTELEKEIKALHREGRLDEEIYNNYLASFDFECQKKLTNAASLIIVSVPQPQVQVVFEWQNKSIPAIIPPTYASSVDKHVAELIEVYLEPLGYSIRRVRLPEKLLAVRSGLARYGKNNITFVEGSGSFHRPVVFISDFACETDSWGKSSVMEQCDACSACRKACPAKAIGSDRFQLHAERCITFHNERSNDFIDWLSPAWHNCLVGCMICQKVCPANKEVAKWIETGTTFDKEETSLILNRAPEDRLPRATFEKLKSLDIKEYYHVLGRNLKALIEQQI